ncbi:hypothetical protein BN1356_00711 [Streptococcus varani]|uniref:Uncharacterized protein n=1 Tax=Streptococcus varani TaxID=1608583 RepID=A0A0E4H393_9STRE|nr:hypothetical protein [Streptococcus varani]CQR24356.1 hypothetical protein BN1356_00711 [Streptococcus varani]
MINNKYDDNFSSIPSPVIPLRTNKASAPVQNNGIIDLEKHQEETNMPQDTYSKSEIDLKFDKISSDIQHGFDKVDLEFNKVDLKFDKLEQQINLKFDSFERRIENLLLSQENKRLDEQAKNKKEFMYWAIGILVALASVAFPIWFRK